MKTTSWREALVAMETHGREAGYTDKTIRCYCLWINKFRRMLDNKPVNQLTADDADYYIQHLITERMSPSSQAQANCALVFFYHYILLDPLPEDLTPRARRFKLEPTILTTGEIYQIVKRLEMPYSLVAKLMYGCGLRLGEAIGLRLADIDTDNKRLRIYPLSTGVMRFVPIPGNLVDELTEQVYFVIDIFVDDCAVGFDGAFMSESYQSDTGVKPDELPGQYLFPAKQRTHIRDGGKEKAFRYHLHESWIQRVFVKALSDSKIALSGGLARSLRHSCCLHLLEAGYSDRVVQQFMGHRDIKSTQFYRKMLPAKSESKVFVSPLDKL